MNIFVLDQDAGACARAHVDKHVVKMPLETAQLLSTALLEHGAPPDAGLYKATHRNHPCAIWARETRANFDWLCLLGIELGLEYTHRYGKDHASIRVVSLAAEMYQLIPEGPLTPFALAMPEAYRCADPVTAYRAYYRGEKADLASWRCRETPAWWHLC